jgi:hypothetical protein
VTQVVGWPIALIAPPALGVIGSWVGLGIAVSGVSLGATLSQMTPKLLLDATPVDGAIETAQDIEQRVNRGCKFRFKPSR